MTDILAAEDDASIRAGLAATLESEGYSVRTAADGAQAMEEYRKKRPDLLLLDVMMPEKSGWDVCTEIRRADPSLPVIMLTAKSSETDKVLGLGLGADDYITKPFGMRELLARVAAALRRAKLQPAAHGDAPFRFGSRTVNPRSMSIAGPDGDETAIGRKELEILRMLSSRPGEAVPRDEMLDTVWGQSYCGVTRTLDQYIAQVRKKLGEDSRLLETVHGTGYRYRG